MPTKTSVFLKPRPSAADGRERQQQDIETFIKPAIEQSDLAPLDGQIEGVEVDDISPDLVQKVHEADVVIVDANCYEPDGVHKLSPFLYYFVALAHSLGDKTILVANATGHLPHSLLKTHTLTYSLTDIWRFIRRFKQVVEEIPASQGTSIWVEDLIKAIEANRAIKPDNPLQEYRKEKAVAAQLARSKAQFQASQAEVQKLQQAQTRGGHKPSSTIAFRRVD